MNVMWCSETETTVFCTSIFVAKIRQQRKLTTVSEGRVSDTVMIYIEMMKK